MSPRNVTEEEFKQLVQNRDRDPVERVRKAGPGSAVADFQDAACTRKVSAVTSSPYKSKWEAAYAGKLELEKRAGLIKQFWYEPFSLWLPGKVRYKPDFMVQYQPPDTNNWKMGDWHSVVEIIEVKGWSKNRRDGITRLKVAAALFPCFVWKLVTRSNGGWDETYI